MDPGDADREQLEERVEQLEETVSKMLPDRRGVLKGLGAAAVGGAAVGGATGGASGQSGAAGAQGTPENPNDMFAWNLDVQNGADFNGTDIKDAGSVSADRIQSNARNAEVVIHKNSSGDIVIDGPNGQIDNSGDILQAIEAAVDAAPSGGWHIHIVAGQYLIESRFDGMTDHLVIDKDGIKLSGAGWATHLRVADNTIPDYDTTTGQDGISIIRVDGQGCSFRDFRIDGNWRNATVDGSDPSPNADGHNLRVGSDASGTGVGDDFTMSGVWSVGSTGDGVEPVNNNHTTITNSIFLDNYEHHAHFNGARDATLSNFVMIDEWNNGAIDTFSGDTRVTEDISISNGIVRGGSVEGININSGVGETRNVSIDNVEVAGFDGAGIRVRSTGSAADAPHEISVTNTVVRDCGAEGVIVEVGEGLEFDDITSRRNQTHGFALGLGEDVVDVNLTDSHIKNNGLSGSGVGILVSTGGNTIDDSSFARNKVLVNDAAATHDVGINFGGGSADYGDVRARDNDIIGATIDTSGYGSIARPYGDLQFPSGSTIHTVDHNWGADLERGQIQLTVNDSVSGGGVPYVTNITSTTFDVQFDTAPSSNVIMSYQILPEG